MSAQALDQPTHADLLVQDWVGRARDLDITQRRMQRRFPFFRVALIMDDNEQPINAFTRDISPDGIGLLHGERQIVGAQMEVSVLLKNRVANLRVHTEWCDPIGCGWYHSGGRFIDLSVSESASLLIESIGSELGRRWRQRYPMFRPMTIKTATDELQGFSFDISLSGMGILLTEPITPQTVFIKSEHMISDRPTALRARVLRCDDRAHGWYVAGCEFMPLGIDELPRIVY